MRRTHAILTLVFAAAVGLCAFLKADAVDTTYICIDPGHGGSELVGTIIEDVPGHRFRSILKAFRTTIGGRKTLIDEGPVRPSLDRTMSGKVVYDSAGVVIGVKPGQPGQAINKSQEYVLVNHFPPEWIGGKGKVYEDEDLWLESLDKQQKRRVLEGVSFLSARFSHDGTRIVGKTLGRYILVVSNSGEVLAKIERQPDKLDEGLMAWIAEPALSPDNKLLLFTRGWDNEPAQSVIGDDIYLRSLSDGSEVRVTQDSRSTHEWLDFNVDGSKAVCSVNGRILLILLGK